jgi:ADP-ribose pyrophosphatase YjhB (NUDIX family)
MAVMDRLACIALLESLLVDPHAGLPSDVFLFVSRITPLVNVDLFVQDDQRRTLLTWRDDEFFGAGWHVPGGIIRFQETAATRITECARDELGADVSFDPAPLLVSEFMLEQRTRGHFISLLYRCRLLTPLDESKRAAADPALAGQWRWHQSCPPDLLAVHRPYASLFR